MTLVERMRHPLEFPLFIAGMVFSAFIWLLLVVTVVGILYGGLIGFGLLIAHALFIAHVRGNGVRISERQLPELYQRCVSASKKLGMDAVPEVYVLQYGGILNAFATKLFSRRFVVLLSSLVEGCEDPRQLDFVIAHELGHIVAGHLAFNVFLAPFRILPWLGSAYSRACEYTCDRLGFHVVGDLEPAQRGLVVLAAGGKQAAKVDLAAFMAQREESAGFWMSVAELGSSHPFLCKRVAALVECQQPGTVVPVRRHWLAYPLAPMLGGGAGGMAFAVALWLGIFAAFMIPKYLQNKQQQEELARQQQLFKLNPDSLSDEAAQQEEVGSARGEE